MTTKASRRRVTQLIQLATLCRFRAGDAEVLGRSAEAKAWSETSAWLMAHAEYALGGAGLLCAPASLLAAEAASAIPAD